jgi:hypothetical protein
MNQYREATTTGITKIIINVVFVIIEIYLN